jgi:hypothetical protein
MAWFHDALDRSPAVEEMDGYLTVAEATEQTGLTPERVRELAGQRVWQSGRWGGVLFVRPAITNHT